MVWYVKILPDNRIISGSSSGDIHISKLVSGKLLTTLKAYSIKCATLTPDKKFLFIGNDNRITILMSRSYKTMKRY